jgi:hypothetical protein
MINLFSFAKRSIAYGGGSMEINRVVGQCQLHGSLCANHSVLRRILLRAAKFREFGPITACLFSGHFPVQISSLETV